MSGGKQLSANASCANTMSTAITRLFPPPNPPSGGASIEVNTETGYKFTDDSRECGTASLGPPGGRSATHARDARPEMPE
jgi:hypothetical protein